MHDSRENLVHGGAEGSLGNGIATRVGRRAIRPPIDMVIGIILAFVIIWIMLFI